MTGFETADWYFEVKVAAVADINNNGLEDWILIRIDEALNGRIKLYETWLVHDVIKQEKLLKAVKF